ncbi:MAG: prepilin-type N-terminal cleavage/methylation domain-containing protein [Puniceicoccales bacterium]|nr:prepilin-type N-terminal cleavage/methylation domain-containing protein [Puniceicoccales bacterium]
MATTHFSYRRKGFSLVEVMLAVGVLSLAILALVGLLGATFQQVDDVVETNRAIIAVPAVNIALESPELIGGEKIPEAADNKIPRFQVVYNFVKEAVGAKKVILYYFNREIKGSEGAISVIPIVYRAQADNFNKETYDKQNGVGPAYRIEITISPMLVGQKIEMEENNSPKPGQSEVKVRDVIYVKDTALPDASNYALAWLPLYLEVYTHAFVDVGTTNDRPQRPILGQNIIINR